MALDFLQHSLWVSTQPTTDAESTGKTTWSKYHNPPDSSFFYIGGNASVSYSNSYNANITGIYSKGTNEAYFTDTASGSVSQISVSGQRVQPANPDDSNINNCSNAKVIELLRQMKSTPQLGQGAYIFRMYNNTQKLASYGRAYDIPVYLDNFSVSTSQDNPNILNISLKFIRRSPVLGLNLGTTTYR